MNLDLDETQSLLRETLRGFVAAEVDLDRVRALEREGGWDEALWRAAAKQGWLGLPFQERHGGAAGSLIEVGLVVEAFARRAAPVPILEVFAAGLALERGSPRAAELVPALIAGECVPVPAVLESGDRFDDLRMTVAADGRLSGEKRFVDYGQFASHQLVAAREHGEPALFLVEARHPGLACRPLRSIGRTPTSRVRYDGVPAERVGGPEAFAALLRLARALAAVQVVACMRQALEMTVEYARVREQFGQPIGRFQAVRHHCANMASRVAAAELLASEALSAIQRGVACDAQVAAAKASASRAAPEVLMLAHQVYGGNGVIEENDLYFFTLRGSERALAWGSADECLAGMADDLEAGFDWP